MSPCLLLSMVKTTGWLTTSIPLELAEQIESFVNSRGGKKLGYTSKTGFIADAIKEKLDGYSGESKKQQTKIEDKINDIHTLIIEMKERFDKIPSTDVSFTPTFDVVTLNEILKKVSSPEYEKQRKIEEEQKIKDIKEIAGSEYVPAKVPSISQYVPKIELILKEKDRFVLMDHREEKTADVIITNGEYFCNLCKEKDCVHIGFVFTLPNGHKKLEKKLTKTV